MTARGTCPNCGSLLTGRYCVACGQDNLRPDLRLGEQLVDAFDAVFGLHSRLVRTLSELSYDPGGVVRRYVQGKRIRYLPPLRYALFTCALWWLAVGLQGVDTSKLSRPARIVMTWAQWINLGLLPPLAASSWLAFVGTRARYVEHLACLAFAAGHMFLARAVLASIGAARPQWATVLQWIDGVLFPTYVAITLWGWLRPRPGTLARHAVAVLRVAVALCLLIVGSGYLLHGAVRFLLFVLP